VIGFKPLGLEHWQPAPPADSAIDMSTNQPVALFLMIPSKTALGCGLARHIRTSTSAMC